MAEDNTIESTNEEVVEESPVESEATQEQVANEPDEVEEVEEVGEPEVETEEETLEESPEVEAEEPKPSRRESLRIQQLISKMKQQPQQMPQVQAGLDYNEALDADPETIAQLEADRQQVAQAYYQQGNSQAESIKFHTRLEIDAPKVESKYPQLDKNSPQFNPAVADAINNWYLATAGYDPQTNSASNAEVRYSDFVEGIMELADEMAGEKVAKTSKNIAKQAATTGLRPDGSSAKRLNLNQDPSKMTDEELEAVISQALPKK